MSKQFHIFDYSFLLSEDTVFGNPWDYFYHIKKDHNTLVIGGQLPQWEIETYEGIFSLSKLFSRYSNDDLKQFIIDNDFDEFFIYINDTRYSVEYVIAYMRDDLVFVLDHLKDIGDYIDYYKQLLEKDPNDERGLLGLDHFNKELDNYFENNMTITLEEEENGIY